MTEIFDTEYTLSFPEFVHAESQVRDVCGVQTPNSKASKVSQLVSCTFSAHSGWYAHNEGARMSLESGGSPAAQERQKFPVRTHAVSLSVYLRGT